MKEQLQAVTPKSFMWKNRIHYIDYNENTKTLDILKTRKKKYTQEEIENFIQQLMEVFGPLGFKLTRNFQYSSATSYRSMLARNNHYILTEDKWEDLNDDISWEFCDRRYYLEITLEIKE